VPDRTSDFADLYARYQPDVYRFALWLTGDLSDADDITAETFMRAWTSSEPIRAATVRGYLFTIARNYFLEGRRKTARQTVLSETIADPRPAPDARAEQIDELAKARVAIAHLAEVDRAAIIMRAVYDMPYEEIARALGVSLSAAKVKVHRARIALARIR
jgi:RNA polymerase sigma-70 factor (ECF subfamily)